MTFLTDKEIDRLYELDDLIEAANKADAMYIERYDIWQMDRTTLKTFAKLVAAKEREACLKIAESMSLTSANMSKTWRTGCRDVAEAIKARGDA